MIIDLVVYYLSGKGKVERIISELNNGLKKRGHTLRVLMAYPPSYTKWLNTLDNVYYYGLSATNNPKNYFEFSKGYKKLLTLIGKPDICLATYTSIQSYICYYGLEENNKLSIPLVSFLQGALKTFYSKESIGFCTSHLAVDTRTKKAIENLVGNKRIYLVGNPVNTENILPISRPNDKLKIIYISTLEAEKNTSYLLNILSKIDENWSLDIIGDGSLLDTLKKQAIELNISEKISWLGWQDEPFINIKEASLLISTQTTDSFSLTLAEGLAHGIPVLSTTLEGNDFIIHGENGWFVKYDDETYFINLLNNIINKYISLPSEDCCKNSISLFESDIVIDKIEKALLTEIKLF